MLLTIRKYSYIPMSNILADFESCSIANNVHQQIFYIVYPSSMSEDLYYNDENSLEPYSVIS